MTAPSGVDAEGSADANVRSTSLARPRRQPVLHPFLLASYPVLFLYAANAAEVPVRDVAGPLGVVVAVVGALVVVLRAALGDLRRAGLVASVLALSVLGYGHVANVVHDGLALLAGWLGLTVALAWGAVRSRRATRDITTILNVVALALVGISLVTVVPAATRGLAGAYGGVARGAPGAATAVAAPDIYYLVLDRYGAAETFEREFAFDNRRFLDFLEGNGFYVADDSYANYLKSAQSIASSLNLSYHHSSLANRYGPETDNQLPVFERLTDHRVGQELRRRGYTYVHIGSWWDPTETNPMADLNLGSRGGSDFVEVLYDTTVAAPLERAFASPSDDHPHRWRHHEAALRQFDALERVREQEGPTFVFAHILLPHEPYVFDRDGDYVPAELEASRSRAENYTEQLRYLNRRLVDFLRPLLDRPEPQRPVVVLQGDEGPHPVRYATAGKRGYNWKAAPLEDLQEKFHVLNAYLLPGVEDARLYEGISPVNTFRLILNAYFDAGLPLLEDRSYVFRDTKHPYDYADITEQLRGG